MYGMCASVGTLDLVIQGDTKWKQSTVSFRKTGLPEWSWLWLISAFLDLWSFKYCIYCIGVVCSRIVSKSFCFRTVQCNLWVLVHLRPSYTLCLVDTRWLWSLCDFFWIYDIDVHLQISIVLGELVSESIVGVVCCCEWSMSFVLVRLGQSVVFCIDLGFFWL